MKYLRWVGLMPSLLIVGLLGRLVAPLPSEAAAPSINPTIKLKLDSGTEVTISTTLSTCTSGTATSDTGLGYNFCYSFTTPREVTGTSGRKYSLQPNGTPRVRISDKNGLDKLSLTGVKFVPVGTWPNTESHTLKITVTATMNATTDGTSTTSINTNNAGLYAYALRSSGEFLGNSGSNPVSNNVTLNVRGDFSSTNLDKPIGSATGTINPISLTFTITGPADTADLNWGGARNNDMGYVEAYPTINCSSPQATSACRPTIRQTLTATIIGPDTLKVLSGPLDTFAAKCTETFGPEHTKQIQFIKAVINGLKFILPQIQKEAARTKTSAIITYLEGIVATTTAPPPDDCPGQKVLAFNVALEVAADALILISRPNSLPGIPANPHYYAVVNDHGLTWTEAKYKAEAIGPNCFLATIDTPAEQAIIEGLLPDPEVLNNSEARKTYWLGGERNTECYSDCWDWYGGEGTFWDNGPILDIFANWGTSPPGSANQPDNSGGYENFLTTDSRYSWGWNDRAHNSDNISGYITEGLSGVCLPAGEEGEGEGEE